VLELEEAGNFPFLQSVYAYLKYFQHLGAVSTLASPCISIQRQYSWGLLGAGSIQWAKSKGIPLVILIRVFGGSQGVDDNPPPYYFTFKCIVAYCNAFGLIITSRTIYNSLIMPHVISVQYIRRNKLL
jgi:hypothetical protein